MTNIQEYTNTEFGTIRTMTDKNGEPWFVGKYIAEILGYSNANKAIQMHVDEDDKKVLDFKGFSQNGKTSELWSGNDYSNKTIINESGVYALIFGSKLPTAKKFKRWVTSEVLPSIRKTGGYHLPQTYADALRELAAQAEETERLRLAGKVKDQQIEELQPKATYYDLVLQTPDAMAISKIAKDYGKSAQWLNQLLYDKRVQYKQGKVWLLYQKYADKGYTQTKTDTFADANGMQHSSVRTCWTQKGRLFIYDLLKQDGILPLIETSRVPERYSTTDIWGNKR